MPDGVVADPGRHALPQQSRQAQIQYWALWVLAGLAVLGLVIKVALDIQVAKLERDAAEKQLYVNQTLAVSRLNVQLIQLLANVAAATGDAGITQLLDEQGIQFRVKQQR